MRMTRQKCVYCNKEITTPSQEHIIQNSLGGYFKSPEICCQDCNNNAVSLKLDKPFTTIFNPIIDNISNFYKMSNKNSNPSYSGVAKYDGKIYDVFIKEGKIVSCPDLSKELKCNASKLPPMTDLAFKFNLDNTAFRNGISKIAFNYALSQGVDFRYIKHGLTVEKDGDKVTKIDFNYPVVPFYPLNPIDAYIELNTPMKLYHNLILFSQYNQLWCYVDLFNTFQFYCLLSEKLHRNKKIYSNYLQTVQKVDHTVPEIIINHPSDKIPYAIQYQVDYRLPDDEFRRTIERKIKDRTPVQPMMSVIGPKFDMIPILDIADDARDNGYLPMLWNSVNLYVEPYNGIREETFRTVTPTQDPNTILSYPDAIAQATEMKMQNFQDYTMAKHIRLTDSLLNKSR